MSTGFVGVLLVFDLLLFVLAAFVFDRSGNKRESLFLSALFLISGMPALIYQVVWQRVLFSIYGVNSESVAVIVSAFMLGLGLGSLAGGWVASRFPKQCIIVFGMTEFGVAIFGLFSLRFFQWASAATAGVSLWAVVVCSFGLLLFPTMLMGATLPLLVEHLVRHDVGVGASVSRLYFANTLGSALACFFCAVFLLRNFGQSGSVSMAACLNAVVGATAYLYARRERHESVKPEVAPAVSATVPALSLHLAMLIAGLSGFLALGFEIAWYRIFALASADRAPAFALLLSTYLAGIAAGAYLSEKFAKDLPASAVLRLIAVLLLLSGAISAYLAPLVASLIHHGVGYLAGAPAFFFTAALLGSVLPLLCQLSVPADEQAGRGVSLVYVSNILGSVAGSLVIGFVLMHHFGLRQVSIQLGLTTVLTGVAVLFFQSRSFRMPPVWALILVLACVAAVPASSRWYSGLYERLIFGNRPEGQTPFANIVENRNGVIAIMQNGAVFGDGVYDGYYNVDPNNDVNMVLRAYALSAFHANPKRMLMIGLASGSWGQIFANHPQVETLDVVEINPGYLQLIPKYPAVASFLQNPKVHVYVDDGRRWLLAHPEQKYDVIVANTTYHWRNHASGLLSVEYLRLIRQHLADGGVYFFNTTSSDEAIFTALSVFPYGLRVVNFLVVSDSPIDLSKDRYLNIARDYRIDQRQVFDPGNPQTHVTLATYAVFADSVSQRPQFLGFESADSLRARMGKRLIITDDNMGLEGIKDAHIDWH
jgi:spermidine synthase